LPDTPLSQLHLDRHIIDHMTKPSSFQLIIKVHRVVLFVPVTQKSASIHIYPQVYKSWTWDMS